MLPITIRWLIGENDEYSIHENGWHMLNQSMKSIKKLIPNSSRVLYIAKMHSKKRYERAVRIADRYNAKPISVLDYHDPNIPSPLLDSGRRSPFWKYIGWKRQQNGNDLIIDNDIVLWRLPLPLQEWMETGGLILSGRVVEPPNKIRIYRDQTADGKGLLRRTMHGKTWDARFAEAKESVFFNTGFLGLGPQILSESLPVPLSDISPTSAFYGDQGWMGYNYLHLNPSIPKYLVDIEDLGYNHPKVSHPLSSFTQRFSGFHFTGHNNGNEDIYSTYKTEIMYTINTIQSPE